MNITFEEKTKYIAKLDGLAFGSITRRGQEYRFKPHQTCPIATIASATLEDLQTAIKEAMKNDA